MKTKTLLCSALLAAALAAPAHSAPGGAAPHVTQQQRMKSCNAEAKSKALKGDERRSFMSSCLRGETAKAAGAEKQAQR